MTTKPSGNPAQNLKDTRLHYQSLRNLTHELTEQEFNGIGAKLGEISLADALEADNWGSQWTDPEKSPIWSWERMYRNYRSNRGVKRFDVAIRAAGRLCALSYGIPSRRRLILKLHALSRSPIGNPLAGNVFRIVLFSASTYASFLGSEELWLMNPQTEGVASFYARFGFQFHRNTAGQTTHMTTRL